MSLKRGPWASTGGLFAIARGEAEPDCSLVPDLPPLVTRYPGFGRLGTRLSLALHLGVGLGRGFQHPQQDFIFALLGGGFGHGVFHKGYSERIQTQANAAKPEDALAIQHCNCRGTLGLE